MASVQEILAGRYELLDVLGRGGMGTVYRAHDRVLDREVAVKVLASGLADDPTFVTRFRREARAAARLSHKNIVSVFDTGHDAGTRFIVMECVHGSTLAQRLQRGGALSAERAAEVAAAIAAALSAAHREGIVHRDIKPGNVMIADSGLVKVLDFGIARAIASTTLTHPAAVVGSAPYLAPEVARGERADARSDIYSLGCVLYAMLTGRPPFTGEVPAAVLHQHSASPPRPPRERNAATPAPLDALVMCMLAKRPARRPQSADELAHALAASPRDPRTPPTALVAAPTLARADAEPTRRLWRAGAGRPRSKRLAALAALALAGAAAALLGASSSSPKRHASNARQARASTSPAPPASRTAPAASGAPPPSSTAPAATSPAPPSVPAAAAQLTALLAQDARANTIDRQAGSQMLAGLRDALAAAGGERPGDALLAVSDLAGEAARLSERGDIQRAASPGLQSAIERLRSALQRAAPVGGGGDSEPPGEGRLKHRSESNGAGAQNGNEGGD